MRILNEAGIAGLGIEFLDPDALNLTPIEEKGRDCVKYLDGGELQS